MKSVCNLLRMSRTEIISASKLSLEFFRDLEVVTFAKALEVNASMTELRLGWNKIGDLGAAARSGVGGRLGTGESQPTGGGRGSRGGRRQALRHRPGPGHRDMRACCRCSQRAQQHGEPLCTQRC